MREGKKKKGIFWKVILVVIVLAAISSGTGGRSRKTAAPVASPAVTAATAPKTEANPQTRSAQSPAPTQTVTQTQPSEQPQSAAQRGDNEISQDLKDFLDSYERFVDEYCEFMKNYNASDLSMLTRYTALIQKELDFAETVEKLDDEEMTTAEALYYSEVMLRCSNKMIQSGLSM